MSEKIIEPCLSIPICQYCNRIIYDNHFCVDLPEIKRESPELNDTTTTSSTESN